MTIRVASSASSSSSSSSSMRDPVFVQMLQDASGCLVTVKAVLDPSDVEGKVETRSEESKVSFFLCLLWKKIKHFISELFICSFFLFQFPDHLFSFLLLCRPLLPPAPLLPPHLIYLTEFIRAAAWNDARRHNPK